MKKKFETLGDVEDGVEHVRAKLEEVERLASPEAMRAAVADLVKPLVDGAADLTKRLAVAEEMAKAATAQIVDVDSRKVSDTGLAEAAKRIKPPAGPDAPVLRSEMGEGAFSLMAHHDHEIESDYDPETARFIRAFRSASEELAMIDAMYMSNAASARAYHERGGPKSTRVWKERLAPMAERLKRAMSTSGAGTGAEWVVTGYSTQVIPDVRQELSLVGFIPSFQMPQNPYKFPLQGIPFKSFKQPENTGQPGPTAIGFRNVQTVDLTFDAVKHAAMLLMSTEWTEDSVVPALQMGRFEMNYAMLNGLEDAALNGQVETVFDADFAPATDDVRASWDGIRWGAYKTGIAVDISGGVVADPLAILKGRLKQYGNVPSETAWATGYMGYAKALVAKDSSGAPIILTADRAGGPGTFLTGLLGRILGSPVVVCNDFPEDMDATGVRVTGGDRTGYILFNRRCLRLGERRGVELTSSIERYFEYDQIALRVTGRYSMKWIRTPHVTNFPCVGGAFGLPVA